jgi:dnd system-associated protein 4
VSTPITDIRVRRPQEHEALLIELREEALFPTFRDILLFAAALGAQADRRIPFTDAGEPIRYDTLREPQFADALVSMIAATELPDDPEIMDGTRLAERVRIFEEYANGGLARIQEQINAGKQPVATVVLALVAEALEHDGAAEPIPVEELLSGMNW